jgi:hypothetical protein
MQVEILRKEGEEKRALMQERIMRLFIGNLQDQIEEQVKMLKGHESVDARIEFAMDENGNPDIDALEGIWITISERRASRIGSVNVDLISLKDEVNKNSYALSMREDEAFAIREHLFEIYNVDKADIHLIFKED